MGSTDNSTGNCDHPEFDTVVVDVDVDVDSNEFEASFKQAAGTPHDMPNVSVGAFVVLVANGKGTHLGIANETSSPGKVSNFSAHLYPLLEPCVLSKRTPDYVGNLPKLTMRHLIEVTSDGSSLCGSLRKLPKADATQLLTQIGPLASSEMLDVFWSESGAAAIDAQHDVQQRYVDNANALFQTL